MTVKVSAQMKNKQDFTVSMLGDVGIGLVDVAARLQFVLQRDLNAALMRSQLQKQLSVLMMRWMMV